MKKTQATGLSKDLSTAITHKLIDSFSSSPTSVGLTSVSGGPRGFEIKTDSPILETSIAGGLILGLGWLLFHD